jgi:hypothetical protein
MSVAAARHVASAIVKAMSAIWFSVTRATGRGRGLMHDKAIRHSRRCLRGNIERCAYYATLPLLK